MEKQLQPLKVSTKSGEIWIEQPTSSGGEGSDAVVISPEQVDVLVQWLKEAQKELTDDPATSR